uniref:Uncharacterized protein n=1 Tax=Anguilla anguilla TaxID=7936 RepID=A0A0E9PGL0_ANGAN
MDVYHTTLLHRVLTLLLTSAPHHHYVSKVTRFAGLNYCL